MAREVTMKEFETGILSEYGTNELKRGKINDFARKFGYRVPKEVWNNNTSEKRGCTYIVSEQATIKTQAREQIQKVEVPEVVVAQKPRVEMVGGIQAIRNTEERYTIDKDENFIRWGNFSDFRAIIKSNKFFPTFVTGLSGNGKTTGIEQACAAENRECIRVNFTRETGADDLVGGLRLINGETVFQYGPVAEAYMRGAILILDELDLADNKILILQGVLEGKPIFIPKLGKKVYPQPGFNVFATANTKGKGSDTGQFIGTNVMNEAFLDRFSITVEQSYPTPAIEKKILGQYAESYFGQKLDERDAKVCDNLVTWAQITRKSYLEGSIDELISTRRLIATVESYAIFGKDIKKSIEYATNRFDDDTKESFVELYQQIDEGMRTLDEDETI